MAMTPSESKVNEIRKEIKTLKKHNAELELQVKFLLERLELKNEQLFKFRTETLNKTVDDFIKFKSDIMEQQTNA
jgi:cell division protein FtsB